MTKLMSKSELIQKVADQHSLSKKDVKGVIEALASVGYKELKKNGTFLLPGFAKFVVIRKPATKERSGINPSPKSRPYSRLDRPEKSFGLVPLKLPRTLSEEAHPCSKSGGRNFEMGQKRHFGPMSALPPKADIESGTQCRS